MRIKKEFIVSILLCCGLSFSGIVCLKAARLKSQCLNYRIRILKPARTPE